jgi:spermidine synthase
MIIELVGSRILAPFDGTSIVTWTSLIGIILASLSLGYYVGGRWADRNPTQQKFSQIVFLSSLTVLVIVILRSPIMIFLDSIRPDIAVKAIIATITLFALPGFLLGMVSPFAAKLKLDTVKKTGGIIGNLYALSTIGSIVGTFLSGFYLIATFTVIQILLAVSFVLFLCSWLLNRGDNFSMLKRGVLFLLIFISSVLIDQIFQTSDALMLNTRYNNVMIYEMEYPPAGKNIRVMSLDGKFDSGIFLDSEELVFEYTKFYHLAEVFAPKLDRVVMIGGAGYVVPRDFLRSYPQAKVDVVEIDPALTELARQHFKLEDDSRLTIYHEDGRTFFNREASAGEKRYDAILLDAFKGYSTPFQLTTLESMQHVYNLLNEDGVMLANVITSIEGDSGKFLRAEYHTLKKVFPYVYVFPVSFPENGTEVQNIMLVGIKSFKQPNLTSPNPILSQYLSNLWTKDISNDMGILVDDFAPVDQYMLKALY